ncbi:hypothetical protein ScPMuIL_007982 [Solemya velum]
MPHLKINRLFNSLMRRKYMDESTASQTKLNRCLTTLDLTALGIGSTLGAGIYVVAGAVARETAGPSVVISFLVAAIASVLAGLCYAEFGARVPKTGSAYVYSYVTVGEIVAFVIGWNLILEYVIGTASVARAWSSYFDSMLDKKIQHYFEEHLPMHIGGLSKYPDFFAFAITLVLTGLLSFGVKESTKFNNVFTCINLLVVVYVIICGLFKVDIKNWTIPKSELSNSTTQGEGGFMPFGFSGMMSGAATCFYAFVGFDCIATTGEEAKNPQKSIPFSIVLSLLAIFIAYFGVSAVLTLMCPYYELDPNAPLPIVFDRVGWGVAKYVIAIGAVCGLSTSLLGAMFPLPRVIYAMSSDGIIFRFLSRVNERFKTPLIATMLSGVFAGGMAMLFDLKELVDMMSIGTLQAYTLVAVCVLLLSVSINSDVESDLKSGQADYNDYKNVTSSHDNHRNSKIPEWIDNIGVTGTLKALVVRSADKPTEFTTKIASWNTVFLCVYIAAFSAVVIFAADQLVNREWWAILLASLFGLGIVFFVYSLVIQPQSKVKLWFKVPGVPILPAASCFINIYLMLKLSKATWIRFGVWMAIGFLVYFTYGIWHSSQAQYEHLPLKNVKNSTAGSSEEDVQKYEKLK